MYVFSSHLTYHHFASDLSRVGRAPIAQSADIRGGNGRIRQSSAARAMRLVTEEINGCFLKFELDRARHTFQMQIEYLAEELSHFSLTISDTRIGELTVESAANRRSPLLELCVNGSNTFRLTHRRFGPRSDRTF